MHAFIRKLTVSQMQRLRGDGFNWQRFVRFVSQTVWSTVRFVSGLARSRPGFGWCPVVLPTWITNLGLGEASFRSAGAIVRRLCFQPSPT